MAPAVGLRAGRPDDGRHLGDAGAADLAGTAERGSGAVRFDLRSIRGADAAVPEPSGVAAARKDRRAPAGTPHERHQPGRRTRAAWLREADAASERPPDDA